MNNELFGFEINVWFDALARVGIIVGFMTVTVMALIYIERKILARFQMRLGPTRTGPRGTLQSVADALKLVGKEDLRPRMADPWTFELAPYVVFVPIFLGFVILPFLLDWHVRILELGLLYFVAVSSVNIVGWVMAGWGSDNRYAMIGGLRAAAQGISYELPLVLALLAAAMLAGSLNLNTIVVAQAHIPYIVWQPLAFFIFFVAALAEMNRPPFDIPVGESEVVGGPFVEYSGIRWSMFFLAEYAALFILALIGASVFLGGWAWPLGEELGRWWQLVLVSAKAGGLIFLVFWVRASVPRLRIDQLMSYSWKVLLPLTFVQIVVNGAVLVYDWPDVVLLATGVVGLGFLFWVTDRAVRRPRPRPALVAQSEAAR
ncbi:MAG: NADH-quinone oxidoreductase subunit NuoH [Candidatus Rokubacteria bacterium]|nr:NADH-quinone oxidoreductase subunit NuoH [Chloroflexota bacterium]MBM4441867.1 NADH-quinone oxidoreductase subunit NuoH [Candidatus Rokubacteria bacterium]